MQNSSELGQDERKLFVEACYHIARRTWESIGGKDPTYSAEMWHASEMVFESGCAILSDFAIIEQVDQGSYKFVIKVADVRKHLENKEPPTRSALKEIIGNFLWFTSGYASEVSQEREPFQVSGILEQVMWAFVACGYATREPEGFKWAPKIAPIMFAECLWFEETGKSFSSHHRDEAADLANQMWKALPVWRRHYLARWIKGQTMLDLQTYLFQRWKNGRFLLRKPDLTKKENWVSLPGTYIEVTELIAKKLLEVRRRHPF